MFGVKVLQMGFKVEFTFPLQWAFFISSFSEYWKLNEKSMPLLTVKNGQLKQKHRSVIFFSAGNLWFASLLGTRTHRCLGLGVKSFQSEDLLVEVGGSLPYGYFWGEIYTYYDGVAAMFKQKIPVLPQIMIGHSGSKKTWNDTKKHGGKCGALDVKEVLFSHILCDRVAP